MAAGEDRRKIGCAPGSWPVPARLRSRPRPGTPKPTLPRHTAGPPPHSAPGLGSPPPAWAAYLAGRRARTSSSLLRAAPPTGPRAARAAPGLPRRFCRPRYHVAMATGRRQRVGGQAGDASGGGRGGRKCPGGSAHPRPGRVPMMPGLGSGGFEAPPGPNLDPSVVGAAARDPRLQRPGLRTRARVTFECGPHDLACGVRRVQGHTGLCCPAGAGSA